MEKFFMEYELNMLKAEHTFENTFDAFSLKSTQLLAMESTMDGDEFNDIIIEEATKFVNSVKEFFETLIENARKLIRDVSTKFMIDIESRSVNKRLKDMKRLLAEGKYVFTKEKVTSLSINEYLKAYTSYINAYVAEYKKLYSKEYDSIDEYEDAYKLADERLENKRIELKIDKEDTYMIAIGAVDAIQLTEAELKNMREIQQEYSKMWESSLKALRDIATSTDNASIIQDVKAGAHEISSVLSKGIRVILRSFIDKISQILRIFKKTDESSSED